MSADAAWVAQQVDYFSRVLFPGKKENYVTEPQRSQDPLVHTFGRAGSNPEVKTSKDGQKSWVRFRMAVDQSYEDGVPPRWFDVSVWKEGLMASVQHQVYKGALVAVEGFYRQNTVGDTTYDNISAVKVGLITWLDNRQPVAAAAPAAPLPTGVTPQMLEAFAAFQASQKAAAYVASHGGDNVPAPVNTTASAAPTGVTYSGDLPF